MSDAKCTFPEWHFKKNGGFWTQKWGRKSGKIESQNSTIFGIEKRGLQSFVDPALRNAQGQWGTLEEGNHSCGILFVQYTRRP